jgi:predicted  nucleic acid-binding Zn-ribbon protein
LEKATQELTSLRKDLANLRAKSEDTEEARVKATTEVSQLKAKVQSLEQQHKEALAKVEAEENAKKSEADKSKSVNAKVAELTSKGKKEMFGLIFAV